LTDTGPGATSQEDLGQKSDGWGRRKLELKGEENGGEEEATAG